MGQSVKIGNTGFSSGFSSGFSYEIPVLSAVSFVPTPTVFVDVSVSPNSVILSSSVPIVTTISESVILASTAGMSSSAIPVILSIGSLVTPTPTSGVFVVKDPLLDCNECALIQQATMVISVPEHTVCILVPDWDTCSDTPNDYWDNDSDCYEKTKCLYDDIQIGMINQYGIDVTFYTTDYNTSHDIIFGEDNDRHVIRSFEVMSTFDLPANDANFDKMGIFGLDEFHMYTNKSHFSYMSTTSGNVEDAYSDYIPHVGDIVCYNAESQYYEIISVKDKVNQFMQSQFTWDFLVRPFRDNKLTLSVDVSGSPLSAYVDTNDILEVNDVVDTEVSGVNYQPPTGEQNPWSQW